MITQEQMEAFAKALAEYKALCEASRWKFFDRMSKPFQEKLKELFAKTLWPKEE